MLSLLCLSLGRRQNFGNTSKRVLPIYITFQIILLRLIDPLHQSFILLGYCIFLLCYFFILYKFWFTFLSSQVLQIDSFWGL